VELHRSTAIQSGLAQRDTRRAQRGAGDLRAQQPVSEGPEVVPEAEEIDLSKVDLPADLAAVIEGDVDATAPKRKPIRARKALVKAE
jgi:small subunit ribosomal protein S2